jgi:hypothetical protein
MQCATQLKNENARIRDPFKAKSGMPRFSYLSLTSRILSGRQQSETQTYDWGTKEVALNYVNIAPGKRLAPRSSSQPPITVLPERWP